jgi:hypothetical protein
MTRRGTTRAERVAYRRARRRRLLIASLAASLLVATLVGFGPVATLLQRSDSSTSGVSGASGTLFADGPVPPRNVSIDYSHEVDLSPLAFGADETGYRTPNVLPNDRLEAQRLKALGLGYMRMHLVYSTSGDPNSKIVCGGTGCDTGPAADDWITAVKATGAVPVVIVNADNPTDAANMVRAFNVDPSNGRPDPSLSTYVPRWIIGNEPNMYGLTASSYSAEFNTDADAMKAVDPGIKLGGPATAWLDESYLQTFLSLSGSRVDFIDFHGYPTQPCSACGPSPAPTLFAWAASIGSAVARVHQILQSTMPARAAQIDVEVGEWSLSTGNGIGTRTNLNVVWGADVIGQIIRNGGLSLFYGTKGNMLEWQSGDEIDGDRNRKIFQKLDETLAPYHSYGMFTGEGLFPHFGSKLARSSTQVSNVDVFASDGGQRNIVVVNKDPTQKRTLTFRLSDRGSGTITLWQKSQGIQFLAPPKRIGTFSYTDGAFSVTVPALSVTTFVQS